MLRFKYTRYFKCDLCNSTSGSVNETFLPERGQMLEIAFPDSWLRIGGIHGQGGLQICDKHQLTIDGKTVDETKEIGEEKSQEQYKEEFWNRKS